MKSPIRTIATALLLCSTVLSAAPMKLEEWTDTQGAKFKGEPVEAFGPIGLFRTGKQTGRKLPFRFLKEEDCARFERGLQRHPARELDWSASKSEVSQDLLNHCQVVRDGKLVEADLRGRPEPIAFIIFYASNGEGPSWDMLGTASGPYWEIQKKHPGVVEGVLYGVRHSLSEHANMAKTMNVPWLVTDFYKQANMETLRQFAPAEGFGLLVLSRHGVPLFSAPSPDKDTVTKTLAELSALLDLMRPENVKAWADRAYYEGAVRKSEYAKGKAEPLLVGNPLLPEGLRQRKIYQLEARLTVAADGTVSNAELVPEVPVPEKLAPALLAAFKKAVFVPAVENGVFVEGTYLYRYKSEP